MTPEDLIHRLRARALLSDSSEAADLIEELLAENRRLRDKVEFLKQARDEYSAAWKDARENQP